MPLVNPISEGGSSPSEVTHALGSSHTAQHHRLYDSNRQLIGLLPRGKITHSESSSTCTFRMPHACVASIFYW